MDTAAAAATSASRINVAADPLLLHYLEEEEGTAGWRKFGFGGPRGDTERGQCGIGSLHTLTWD